MKDTMKNTNSLNKIIFNAIATLIAIVIVLLSGSAYALTTSVNTLSVGVGSMGYIKISGKSGKVAVTNSAPTVVILSKSEDSTYKIVGVAAGSATVTFKDSKSTVKVNVIINSNNATSLAGRLLASNCFQCHGTNGSGGFEKLTGKSALEIYSELKKFSTGSEDPNGIMAAHAMGFSDVQLDAIANYFASQP